MAFPDFMAAVAEERLFWLVTDASADGLGAEIEQAQRDKSM